MEEAPAPWWAPDEGGSCALGGSPDGEGPSPGGSRAWRRPPPPGLDRPPWSPGLRPLPLRLGQREARRPGGFPERPLIAASVPSFANERPGAENPGRALPAPAASQGSCRAPRPPRCSGERVRAALGTGRAAAPADGVGAGCHEPGSFYGQRIKIRIRQTFPLSGAGSPVMPPPPALSRSAWKGPATRPCPSALRRVWTSAGGGVPA